MVKTHSNKKSHRFLLRSSKFHKRYVNNDSAWFRCSLINRYIVVTRDAIYTLQYNQSQLISLDSINIIKILSLEKFDSARIASNENKILLYTTRQQKSSIQIYDKQFNKVKTFDSTINKQLPVKIQKFNFKKFYSFTFKTLSNC